MNRKQRSDQNPTHCARFKRRNTLVYFSDDNARDGIVWKASESAHAR